MNQDLAGLIITLEAKLATLKVQYEQYFMGVITIAPTKLHREVKNRIRELHKAPFKRVSDKFKIKSIEDTYQTYNNYWERVMREKEEGTYYKDLFKADIREKQAAEDRRQSDKSYQAVKGLYDNYKSALEKNGFRGDIPFDAFQKKLSEQAKAIKASGDIKKVVFSISVKEGGKVVVQAKGKR